MVPGQGTKVTPSQPDHEDGVIRASGGSLLSRRLAGYFHTTTGKFGRRSTAGLPPTVAGRGSTRPMFKVRRQTTLPAGLNSQNCGDWLADFPSATTPNGPAIRGRSEKP